MAQITHGLYRQAPIQYQDASTNTGDPEPQVGDKVLILRNQTKSELEQEILEPARPRPETPPATPPPTNNQIALRMMKQGAAASVTGGLLVLGGYTTTKAIDCSSQTCTGITGTAVATGSLTAIGGVVMMVRGALRFVTGNALPEPVVNFMNDATQPVADAVKTKLISKV